jgi:uncharacterized membrane protein
MITLYSRFRILFLILIIFLCSCSSESSLETNASPYIEAKVLNIISSITLQDQQFNTETQKTRIQVKILNGSDKDKEIVITQELRANGKEMGIPRIGDTVILEETAVGDGTSALQITDYKRNGVVFFSFILFIAFLCITCGIKSLIFLGVISAILVITAFILLPLLSYGISPISLTLVFSCIICTLVNLLIHNFNEKSKSIIVSNFFSLGIVAILAYAFSKAGAFSPLLSGISSQETDAGSLVASAILLASLGGIINISANSFNLTKDIRKKNPKAELSEIVNTTIKYSKSAIFLNLIFVFMIFIGLSLPVIITKYRVYPFLSIINQDIISFYIIALSISGLGIMTSNVATSIVSAYSLLNVRDESRRRVRATQDAQK